MLSKEEMSFTFAMQLSRLFSNRSNIEVYAVKQNWIQRIELSLISEQCEQRRELLHMRSTIEQRLTGGSSRVNHVFLLRCYQLIVAVMYTASYCSYKITWKFEKLAHLSFKPDSKGVKAYYSTCLLEVEKLEFYINVPLLKASANNFLEQFEIRHRSVLVLSCFYLQCISAIGYFKRCCK